MSISGLSSATSLDYRQLQIAALNSTVQLAAARLASAQTAAAQAAALPATATATTPTVATTQPLSIQHHLGGAAPPPPPGDLTQTGTTATAGTNVLNTLV